VPDANHLRDDILAEIDKRLESLPPAPPGQDGERGPKGLRGEPGRDVDVNELANSLISEIVPALPPVLIQYSDGDPDTVDQQVSARLGEVIVIPPQRIRIRDGDETFDISEALGAAIRIKVTGGISASAAK